jgi:hypothetical protein
VLNEEEGGMCAVCPDQFRARPPVSLNYLFHASGVVGINQRHARFYCLVRMVCAVFDQIITYCLIFPLPFE